MIKRGQSWWGWWEKKYFPLPEHGEASLSGFTTTFYASATNIGMQSADLSVSGFDTTFAAQTGGALALSSFDTEIDVRVRPVEVFNITGFETEFLLLGGGELGLSGFTTTFTATAIPGTLSAFDIPGFSTTFSLQAQAELQAVVSVTGFDTAFAINAGSTAIAITGFDTTVSVAATGLSQSWLGISGFGTAFDLSSTLGTKASLSIGGFETDWLWGALTLSGFDTDVRLHVDLAQLSEDHVYAVHLVNGEQGVDFETTRYTGYAFTHIVRYKGVHYGLQPDGLYLLEGNDDAGTVISASFRTAMSDFGTAKHKRVPYLYLDTEDVTVTTTFVEGQERNSYASGFGGARTRLGRGDKGRHWQFEVENVTGGEMSISSLEIYPNVLSRKV